MTNIFVVQIVPIDEKSKQQMTKFLWKYIWMNIVQIQ
jgi:hypothetical protein